MGGNDSNSENRTQIMNANMEERMTVDSRREVRRETKRVGNNNTTTHAPLTSITARTLPKRHKNNGEKVRSIRSRENEREREKRDMLIGKNTATRTEDGHMDPTQGTMKARLL